MPLSTGFCPLVLSDTCNLFHSIGATTCWRSSTSHIAVRSQIRRLSMRTKPIHLLLFLGICGLFSTCSIWGAGSVVIMRNGEVATMWTTKEHEQEPQEVFEPYHTSYTCRSTNKRSYKRACRRAAAHGITWYRGRLVSSAHLGVVPSPHCNTTPRKRNVTPPAKHLKQRLQCFSWNVGGLSADGWDAFQNWLENQHFDLVALQESHWSFSSEWVHQHFYVVHSGAADRRGGLDSYHWRDQRSPTYTFDQQQHSRIDFLICKQGLASELYQITVGMDATTEVKLQRVYDAATQAADALCQWFSDLYHSDEPQPAALDPMYAPADICVSCQRRPSEACRNSPTSQAPGDLGGGLLLSIDLSKVFVEQLQRTMIDQGRTLPVMTSPASNHPRW